MASRTNYLRHIAVLAKRMAEELFPFVFFIWHARKKGGEAAFVGSGGEISQKYAPYRNLPNGSLSKRLKEEHERAKAIDEKTVKLTFSISLALTLMGAVSGYLSNTLEGVPKLGMASATAIAIFYTLVGGVLALGALRTLPIYGYGSEYLLLRRRNRKAAEVEALVAQETINIVRQLRNEAAYQCLRNGFFVLLVSAAILVFSLYVSPKECSTTKQQEVAINDVSQ